MKFENFFLLIFYTSLRLAANSLEDMFTPRPDEPLTFDTNSYSIIGHKISFTTQGIIRVHPTSKTCVMITIKPDESDHRICDETLLNWTLKDLDIQGRVRWSVQLTKDTPPKDVVWQTPYRIGKYVPLGNPWPGQTLPIGILECKKFGSFRRIRLTLLENVIWTIGFPESDTLTPQPVKMSNLPIYKGSANAGFIKIESLADKENSNKKKEEEGADEDEGNDNEKIVTDWQIHPRNSNAMDGSYFFQEAPSPAQTHLNQSECRYKYVWESDPSTGVIECHNAGSARWILLPLTCLADIKL